MRTTHCGLERNAGLLCISAFEAIARKQRDMMAVIAVSAGMTWLVSAPSAVLVRAMRSSPAWMMLVCWVAVLREVSGFAHGATPLPFNSCASVV